MGIDASLKADVLYIKVIGRFDFGMHNDFRQAIKLIGEGVKRVEVDFADTDYLDSSALGMLLVLRDKVGASKTVIEILKVKPEVRKILEIANFDKLFNIGSKA
jgi:anti-anti-sigma factor